MYFVVFLDHPNIASIICHQIIYINNQIMIIVIFSWRRYRGVHFAFLLHYHAAKPFARLTDKNNVPEHIERRSSESSLWLVSFSIALQIFPLLGMLTASCMIMLWNGRKSCDCGLAIRRVRYRREPLAGALFPMSLISCAVVSLSGIF